MEWKTFYRHSGQAGDLVGGNGRPRILQHASEMFVTDLVLQVRRDEMKKKKWKVGDVRILQGLFFNA